MEIQLRIYKKKSVCSVQFTIISNLIDSNSIIPNPIIPNPIITSPIISYPIVSNQISRKWLFLDLF